MIEYLREEYYSTGRPAYPPYTYRNERHIEYKIGELTIRHETYYDVSWTGRISFFYRILVNGKKIFSLAKSDTEGKAKEVAKSVDTKLNKILKTLTKGLKEKRLHASSSDIYKEWHTVRMWIKE